MSLRQKTVRGAIWSAIENWGTQIVSTAIFLLLARLLGAEAFGLIALANVFLAFMQIFLDQGFAQAIIQQENLEQAHLDTAFWISVLTGILFVVMTLSGAGFVANFYSEPQLAPIIRWMSLSFLFGGLSSVQSAILQRNMQFKIFAARSLVATAACGVAGVGAALMGLGVWSLVVKEIVFGTTGALLLWGASDWRPSLKFSIKHSKELLSFGISIIGFNFLNFFNRRSDDMLIGYYLGPVALGYYSVAYRLLLVMLRLLIGVTSQVALPMLAKIKKELGRFRNAFYEATQYTSLISFPAFLGMAALAPEIVTVVFGSEWLPSIPVMRILAFIGILESISQFNSTAFLALGKPGWRLAFQVVNVIFTVTTFIVVVRWGIVAVALGFVIRGYLLFPISLWMVKKLTHISIRKYLLQFRDVLLSASVMVGAIALSKHLMGNALGDFALLAICVPIAALAYLGSIFVFSPAIIRDIRQKFT